MIIISECAAKEEFESCSIHKKEQARFLEDDTKAHRVHGCQFIRRLTASCDSLK